MRIDIQQQLPPLALAGKMIEPVALALTEAMTHCPLFTENHAQHSAVWSVPGFSLPTFCIACVIERLERWKGELGLHLRKVLREVQALLAEGAHSRLLALLKSDKRVLERMCSCLLGKKMH